MVAKPRDMVLLGADVRLPHTSASAFKQEPSASASSHTHRSPLRLASTCASIEDPSLPPRKGYQRFHLVVGGFMVEDLSSNPNSPAIRITQVSDLGPASTWLPSSIIKMVAQTLVPRSMSGIRKIAEKIEVPRALSSDLDKSGKLQTKINGDGEEVQILNGAGGEWPVNRGLPGMLGDGALDFTNRKEGKAQQASKEIDVEHHQPSEARVVINVSHALSASVSAREEQERLAREAGDNLSKSMRRISMLLARADSDENTSGNSSELESCGERSEDDDDDRPDSSEDEDEDSREDEPQELEDSMDRPQRLLSSTLSKLPSKAELSNDEDFIEQLHDDRGSDSISLSGSVTSLRSLQRSVPSSPLSGRRPNQGMRLGLDLGVRPSSSSASLPQGALTPPPQGLNSVGANPANHQDLSPFSSACSSSSYFSHGTSSDALGWRGGKRGLNNGLTGGVYVGMGLSDERFRRATLNLARHVVGGPPSSVHGSELMSRSQSNQSHATQSVNGRSEMSEEGELSENESLRGIGSSIGDHHAPESDEDARSRSGNDHEEDDDDYDRTLLSSALRTNSSPTNSPNRLPSINTLNLSSPSQKSLKCQSESSSPTSTSNCPTANSPPVSPTRRHPGGFPSRQSPLRKQHDWSPRVGHSSRSLLQEVEESRDPDFETASVEEEIGESRQPSDEHHRVLSTLEESPVLKDSLDSNQDSQGGDIAFLLAEALGQDLRPPDLRKKPCGNSKKQRRSARAEGSRFSIRSGVGSPSRRELKLEREAKRLSAMLLMGSDQLAMAIAPGARGSSTYRIGSVDDGDEFGISDIVIEDPEEDEIGIAGNVNTIPNLDSNQRPFTSRNLGQFTGNPQFLAPGDGLGLLGEGKPSAEGRRPSADSSGSSAHTTTGLESSTNNVVGGSGSNTRTDLISTPSMVTSLYSRSRRVSENNITVGSSLAPPATTATSVLVGSINEKAATLQELHADPHMMASFQDDHSRPSSHQETMKAEETRRWGSSLTGAPYTLVIGLASLAWATRYSSQAGTQHKEVTQIVTPDGSKIDVKQRAPSSSAADAVRRVMNGDLERRNTAPPISLDIPAKQVLKDSDSKILVASPTSMSSAHPTPDLGVSDPTPLASTSPSIEVKGSTNSTLSNRSSHTVNATNSKYESVSGPSYRTSASGSSLKSSSSSIKSRSSKFYAYNGGPAIIPEDGSVDRAFSRGNYAFNDKLHPFPASLGRKELPPIGSGIGAVPLEVGEREAQEEEQRLAEHTPQRMQRVEDAESASYISWISGYLPAGGR